VFAGVFITIDKLAAALAAGATGVILGAFGYISSSGPKVVQPQSAIQAIYLVASMPALLMLLSCLLMLRYRLTEDMLLAPATRSDPHSVILDNPSSP
jgi:Na+/melibiose symporter-like transporter